MPNSDLVNSDLGNTDDKKIMRSGLSMDLQNPDNAQFGPEKAVHFETVAVAEGEDGSENSYYISSVPGIVSHLDNGGSIKPEIGPASRADGVAGPGNGKRRIVKKVVRVVKKVIKKRVPKRILKHDYENQGPESEVATDIPSSHNDEIPKSNAVDLLIEKPSIVNEMKEIPNITVGVSENSYLVDNNVIEKSNLVDGVTEVINGVGDNEYIKDEMNKLEHVTSADESKPISGVKGNDVNAIDSAEKDIAKLDFSANAPELIVPAEKVNYIAENLIEANETAGSVAQNQAKDSVLENQTTCIISQCEVVTGETNGRSTVGEYPESAPVEADDGCSKMNEGLILSDKMETLEGKTRQNTEIFVGGLDSNTNGDDIRKVFEEAGEVLDVRLIMSGNTGRNRGFAFVRFSTDTDAKNALAKYSNAEICGKKCNVAPVGGNNTIFLGNIDKNWKTEDLVTLLEKAEIGKIDKVTLKVDPNNVEKNRGFAFVEFETYKYAQVAFSKLQKKDVFGKKLTVKVEWAQPLIEPAEEETLKVKCVYAQYLPSSWDEKMVKKYFKRFGEIEYVILSKDLNSSKRKDFAFIHYKNRDAALRCIEFVNRERSEDHGSKFKIDVSLANSIKQMKRTADQTSKHPLKPKPKPIRTSRKLYKPIQERKPVSSSYNDVMVDDRPTTTDELVQILRQQASNKHLHPHLCPRTGTNAPDLHFPLPGSKRPFSQVGYDSFNAEPQILSRAGVESSYRNSGPSSSSHGVAVLSVPYCYSQQRLGFTTESAIGRSYPGHLQEREQASPYYRDNNLYRRCELI